MSCVYIFTNAYPYDNAEPFFHEELLLIAQKFEKVVLLPLSKGDKINENLPINISIIDPLSNQYISIKKALFTMPKLLFIFLYEIVISNNRISYIKGFKTYFTFLISWASKVKVYKSILDSNTSNVYYTYWLNEWSIMLSLYKNIYNKNAKLISKIHGYDFDEVQINNSFHPYRNFVLNTYNTVVSISKYGMSYVNLKYPKFKHKIFYNYLGVKQTLIKNIKPSQEKTIVSCSCVIDLKRIDLIIEILKNINTPLTWVHIGDGNLLKSMQLKVKELPSNINVIWKGRMNNSDVLNFYNTTKVDLFINTSDYEGLPFSMIEAISFGISVCGRNICGIPEIVNKDTGILLPYNFNPKEAALEISNYINCSDLEYKKKEENVKNFYIQNFSSAVNHQKFINTYLLN